MALVLLYCQLVMELAWRGMAKPSRRQRKKHKARRRHEDKNHAVGEDEPDDAEDEQDEQARASHRHAGNSDRAREDLPPWRRPKRKDGAGRYYLRGGRVVILFFVAFVGVATAVIWWQSHNP